MTKAQGSAMLLGLRSWRALSQRGQRGSLIEVFVLHAFVTYLKLDDLVTIGLASGV
jgi:hypothetical protein